MVSSVVLYCNRFMILFTQIIHIKQLNKKKHFHLMIQSLKTTVEHYSSWCTGTGIEWTDKKSYWLGEEGEVGDGRAEGSLATGDGGQAAISLNLGNACWHLWKFTTWKFVHRGLIVLNRFIGCHLKSNQLSIKIRTLEWSQSVQTEMLI